MLTTQRKERRNGVSNATSRRLSHFLNLDEAEGRKIKQLEAEGRELQKVHGIRSAPAAAKALEISAVFERRARIGAIVEKLRSRIG